MLALPRWSAPACIQTPSRKMLTMPAVTYRRVSSNRYSAMGVDAEVVKARFQVDVWALTYDSASAVRDQVRAALQRWRTVTGTTVQDTFIISETDLYEDDTHQHHIAMM